MGGSALLLIRLALSVLVVIAAWRFGAQAVIVLLVVLLAALVLTKGRRLRRNLED